jgi:hypothetical protein
MLFGNPLTLQQRAALGSVVMECANLEDRLDLMIGHLFRLSPEQLDILLGGSMLNRKLEVMRQIGKLKIKPRKRLARLIEILDKVSNLNADRVTVVHGKWGPPGGLYQLNWLMRGGPPPGTPAEARHKKSGKVRTVKAEDLDATAKALADCNQDLEHSWSRDIIKPYVKRRVRRSAKKSS